MDILHKKLRCSGHLSDQAIKVYPRVNFDGYFYSTERSVSEGLTRIRV